MANVPKAGFHPQHYQGLSPGPHWITDAILLSALQHLLTAVSEVHLKHLSFSPLSPRTSAL